MRSTVTQSSLSYSIVYPDDDSSETKKEVPNDTGSIGVQNAERKESQSVPPASTAGGSESTQKPNSDNSAVTSFEGFQDFDETDPENAVYDYVDSASYEK